MIEEEPAVVDSGQTHLGAAVRDGDPGRRLPGIVTDGDENAVHPVVLATDDELGEDGGHPAVPGSVADVVLAGAGVGGVDDDLVGFGVVGRGGVQVLDVGAPAGLRHRETPEQAAVDDGGQVCRVVPLGAQVGDRAAEEPELHAGLDEEGEVDVAEHLEGRDAAAVVTRAALLGRQPHGGKGLRGELVEEAGRALAVVLHGHRALRWTEVIGVEIAARLLPDRVPTPVEDTPEVLGHKVSGGSGAHVLTLGRPHVPNGSAGLRE